MRKLKGGKPRERNESKGQLIWLIWDQALTGVGTIVPSHLHVRAAETERTRWDPKDGELCLSRMKPGETLVEVRSGSDVQIDRQTWV